jgi:hypothetical protein
MYPALIKKELREMALFGALAVIAHLILISGLMGLGAFREMPVLLWFSFIPQGGRELPLIGGSFLSNFTIVSGFFAVMLAFRQTFWENAGRTDASLFQRPIYRDAVIIVKILTGLGFFFLCSSVPIFVYSLWAATPGNSPSPFEWSMTGPAVRIMLCTMLLYLGMFLTMLRPARWFATKIFPLIACGVLAAGLTQFPWWRPWGVLLLLMATGLLIANSCHVARARDY